MSSAFGSPSGFRSSARTHRVPVLLLSLLAGTLLFPRLLDDARVAVAAWLPPTVPREAPAPDPLPSERIAALQAENERLRNDLAAREAGEGALAAMAFASRAARERPIGVPARVLHRGDPASGRRSFVIDAGRTEGVVPGLAVVQCDSLLGVVVTASGRAARVLRIDDRSAATTLPAVVLDPAATGGACRGTGVARGTGDGLLRVSFLPPDGARVGDLVTTGAGSSLVPEGLVLGEVIECGDADRDGGFDAVVRPLRDLDAVASVIALRVEPPGLRVDAK